MESYYEAVKHVLEQRGIEFKPADLWGFVAAAWPTDSEPEEMADDWQTARLENE